MYTQEEGRIFQHFDEVCSVLLFISAKAQKYLQIFLKEVVNVAIRVAGLEQSNINKTLLQSIMIKYGSKLATLGPGT